MPDNSLDSIKPDTPLDPINPVPLHPRPGVDMTIERYGHFDVPAREYVITRPDTPQPWYNYLTNGTFGGYVSQTGGGTCFYRDPVEARILRVHLHGRPVDQPGRWVYIRDRATGQFHSATWAPTAPPLDTCKYECRVGMGYTTITMQRDQIASTVTYFVAQDAPAELWHVRIRNAGRRKRQLDVFPFAEFLYWSLTRDNNLDAAFKCTDVGNVGGRCIVHRSYYDFGAERGGWRRQFSFFGASRKPTGFDTSLDAFTGVHRGYDRPLAVERGSCSNYVNRGGEPIAAMHFPLELAAGEEAELVFAVGFATSDEDAQALAARVTRPAYARRQLAGIRRQWRQYVASFQAQTPEPALDVPFNTWSAYQNAITFVLSRSIAPYLLLGTRGLGFRDSNQDTLGAMPYQPPEATKRLIGTLLAVQRPDGEACHDFFPGTGQGQGGGYWDDHLWACLSTEWYVKESGDLGFLDQAVGFHEKAEQAPVIEHLERALAFTDNHLGQHGLPLLGVADWNDCLNAFPGAESVFTAGLYCAAAKAVQSLHQARGDAQAAQGCASRHAAMAERINRHAWDGAWYTRLITREGDAIGSARNTYGKIFIESNVWAVIGQAAPDERARQALDSVRQHLGTPYGHRICAPPYPHYDPAVGTCTLFGPGLKENGSVFCHTNPWLVVAEAMLGRGGRAFDVFRRISPFTKDQIQAVHCAEPYAANSLVYMPPNLEAGRARNPWLTGFAAWLLACMGRAILGIRPELGGLVIDPCVPGWKKLRIRRVFRGAEYDISVRNPSGVERGVRSMKVDGRELAGHLAPLPRAGQKKVKVEVVMG